MQLKDINLEARLITLGDCNQISRYEPITSKHIKPLPIAAVLSFNLKMINKLGGGLKLIKAHNCQWTGRLSSAKTRTLSLLDKKVLDIQPIEMLIIQSFLIIIIYFQKGFLILH